MQLRPHHLLCIQKFTGHGYDEPFTQHMTSIVSALKSHPQTEITVTQGCDDLCQRCPNNHGGTCTSLEKVAGMDAAVLQHCGLTPEETAPWHELARKARQRILDTAVFQAICSNCQWVRLCQRTGHGGA